MSISLVPIPLTIYDSLNDTASIAYYAPASFVGKSLVSTASNAIVTVVKSGLSDTIPVLESPAVISYLATTSLTGVASLLYANVAGTNVGSASSGTANVTKRITYGSGATGVKYTLPAITKGLCFTIVNTHATSTISVYPTTGDYINALAVDTAVDILVGESKTFYTKSISVTAVAKKGWFSL